MDGMTPFLRTIAENPDDDTSRLVFADWLEEHEHHERAKFIRLQIELARMDPGDDGYPEKTAAMRRCGMFTTEGVIPFFDHLPTDECKFVFQRGFIESIDTTNAEELDTSGFDLIPLLALRTGSKHIDKFKGFTKLKWLECYGGREISPAKLLEILGPKGWFKELEELSLSNLDTPCLEAGVIPKFDLPKLRNFVLATESFYNLGVFTEGDGEEEDDYGESRSWSGLPDYLPKNAIPNKKSPLERFVWHCDDDSDYYRDGDTFWAGPTMESLLAHLKAHKLKQVEVAVDWDDHENGAEGINAARYQQNPLKLCPTLDHITLAGDDLPLLNGSTHKLKGLRVYAEFHLRGELFTLLAEPCCSELESLHVEVRGGGWGRSESTPAPDVHLPHLRTLYLSGGQFGDFSGCRFPRLLTLLGFNEVQAILKGKWPKLQHLCVHVGAETLPDLRAFAQSDCCPNLTTLTITGSFYSMTPDFSFLANCPHMPFLSLIRFSGYPNPQSWIRDDGELLPVRSDVMMDKQTPSTVYRVAAVFESTMNEH